VTLARDLSHSTVERIVDRFGLTEVTAADGGALLPLPGPMPGAGGECRVWHGDRVETMVYVGLAFPPANLDSHMLFAFTPGDSAVPHFTVDSVMSGPTFAFHLDLIPRADLGAHLAYMDAVYAPITDVFEAGRAIEGLSAAALSPRQLALMSPWMLAYRATEEAFSQIDSAVLAYFDHWTKLLDNGLPSDALEHIEESALRVRDRNNRAALFNPDVDPVWNQINPLIGDEASARIRALLRGEE